jgi:uncharacterized membrane protein YeiH
VFATSGALMAIRKGFDVVGIVILATITALGGGILRDLVIGATPPAALVETSYLVIPLVASAITFFAHPVVEKLNAAILVFDAMGLSLFTVTGTLKALDYGLELLQAVILGVMTGVGGGVLRDVIAMETPALVKVETDLYAIPAAAGAVIVGISVHFGLPLAPFSIGAAMLSSFSACWRWSVTGMHLRHGNEERSKRATQLVSTLRRPLSSISDLPPQGSRRPRSSHCRPGGRPVQGRKLGSGPPLTSLLLCQIRP